MCVCVCVCADRKKHKVFKGWFHLIYIAYHRFYFHFSHHIVLKEINNFKMRRNYKSLLNSQIREYLFNNGSHNFNIKSSSSDLVIFVIFVYFYTVGFTSIFPDLYAPPTHTYYDCGWSVWFGLLLWHINHCRLFNAKFIFILINSFISYNWL